jgi:hypothetical protein
LKAAPARRGFFIGLVVGLLITFVAGGNFWRMLCSGSHFSIGDAVPGRPFVAAGCFDE